MTITVEVRGGNLEKAMRVLKKKVQKEGIVKEIKRRQFYMKPSEVKREKKKEGIKNYKKKMAKLQRELQRFHACAYIMNKQWYQAIRKTWGVEGS